MPRCYNFGFSLCHAVERTAGSERLSTEGLAARAWRLISAEREAARMTARGLRSLCFFASTVTACGLPSGANFLRARGGLCGLSTGSRAEPWPPEAGAAAGRRVGVPRSGLASVARRAGEGERRFRSDVGLKVGQVTPTGFGWGCKGAGTINRAPLRGFEAPAAVGAAVGAGVLKASAGWW